MGVRGLLRQQIEEIWGAGRLELVDANYCAEVRDHMPLPGQKPPPEGLRDAVLAFRRGFPDLSMTLHGTLAAGDAGVDFWTMRGTHQSELFGIAATGRVVEIGGIDFVRCADGRISEIWHVEELASLYAQLGADMPPFEGAGQPTRAPLAIDLADHPDSERCLAIARRHIEEVWAGNDPALASRIYVADVIDMNPAPGQRPGVEGVIEVLVCLRRSIPNLRMEIRHYVVDPPFAADRWIMRGTHDAEPLFGIPATGKCFEINGMDVIRIRADGRIDAIWHAEEMWQLAKQIG